ncbi:MAG TPA: MFS transporter [Tepidisphaeraceae bacterium]|nr:MFS transporter [Tepidisphaeraceae bacterium]
MNRISPTLEASGLRKSADRAGNRGAGLVLLAAFLGWMFDGLEMGIFPLAARPALQQMMHTTNDAMVAPWVGYITASFLLGAAAGGLVFGWLGDRIGRVRSMSLSVLCYSLFTGVGFFAAAPWHLLVLRFIAALGMGGEWSLGVALVMECWPEARRPLLAGLIGAASNVGFALIAALGMVFKVTPQSWRWVMLAGVAPAVLTFFIRLFVPESQKWKQSVADSGPARPLHEVTSPPLLSVTLLAVAFASIALIGTWGSVQWIPTWVDKLTGGGQPHAKAVSQVVSSLGAVVGGMFGALLAGRWGRRVTYFGLCTASLLLCAILFRGFHAYTPGLLGMIFLVGTATAAFYGWLPLYLPELFPTRVRATGQGLGYNLGRVFAAAGALGSGSLVSHFGGSYARAGAMVTLIYLLGMGLIWFAPETKGKPLPE